VDTVLYTLSGLASRELGWGREGETWRFMAALEQIGGETWFRLGDGDLAVHVERTRRLAAGQSLSEVTAHMARRLGVDAAIMPMCDETVATRVHTAEHGVLPFQEYFVKRGCSPPVTRFEFAGIDDARPAPGVSEALSGSSLRAVVICPSNPFISVDPVLAVPGLRELLSGCGAPVVAVSPVIGGQAVKGPTAKMMAELSLPVTAAGVAAHYGDLLHGFVLDEADAALARELHVPCEVAPILMRTDADKRALAAAVLAFADTLRP
jgi:LPPG:FO 2-phospho-L-lactate transferase